MQTEFDLSTLPLDELDTVTGGVLLPPMKPVPSGGPPGPGSNCISRGAVNAFIGLGAGGVLGGPVGGAVGALGGFASGCVSAFMP